LEDNTIETPIPDGGGLTQALTGRETRCSNAPRTFLNEQDCKLSYSASACGSISAPQLVIELNQTNIATLHNITGQYVYGVLGLPVVDYQGNELESPCTVGLRSRWEIKDAAECTNITTLEAATNATLVTLLTRSSDKNPFIRDVTFPTSGYSCGAADTSALAKVEIVVGPTCYKRVHPEHLSVYDFTYWTLENTHPGNMIAMMEGEPNPIKKWSDVLGTVFLTYPAFPSGDVPKHPIERWNTHSVHFGKLGRFGDTVKFVDLPNELRTDEVSEYYGESAAGGAGILVCGSPNEVANDPELGYQFDVVQGQDTEWGLEHQREYIWAMVGLNAEDQLRQRVAWALAQILVVVPSGETFFNAFNFFNGCWLSILTSSD
jgi:cullin-associated NEDD8-dissociated protein 1